MEGSGFRVEVFGFRVSGFGVSGFGFRILGVGLRVWGSGSGLRVRDPGSFWGVSVRIPERFVLPPACELLLLLGDCSIRDTDIKTDPHTLTQMTRHSNQMTSHLLLAVLTKLESESEDDWYPSDLSFPQPASPAHSAATRWRAARPNATPCSRVLFKQRLEN